VLASGTQPAEADNWDRLKPGAHAQLGALR